MGANAQTSVPTFTAGEVLTAANMNISARTGVPVFADTTARDAGFGGTGEKTLAEGQLCYLESTNVVQYYDGAAWATVGPTTVSSGLTLISSTTIGSAVSTVNVTSAFSSTYDNYRIIISGGASSASTSLLTLKMGATTTGYYYGGSGGKWVTGADTLNGSNAANFSYVGTGRPDGLGADISLVAPNLAKYTYASYWYDGGDSSVTVHGFLANTTQYTDFTIGVNTGTLTGGTIKVYGYANS